jgi:hypothetical protein
LRATIEWSYALLEAHEQEVFTCLGIFPGGWTLDAASEVCNASEQTLRSLVERSLVQAVGERFTMLDTLREFALGQLSGRGISGDVHRRGAEYLAALVERDPACETAPQHEAWLERVGSELDNLRAVISWAFQTGEADIGVRIVGHALHLCEIRGLFSEGSAWAQLALGASGEPSSARARVLSGAAVLAHLQGDWEASARLADEEISLAEALGDRAALALALRDRSASAIGRGELRKAVAMLERCRSVAADRGDSQLLATATTDLGHVRLMRGEKKQAAAVLQEALDLWTARGETGGVGVVLRHLAVSQLDAAEPPQLLEMLHDSIRRTFAVDSFIRCSRASNPRCGLCAARPMARRRSHTQRSVHPARGNRRPSSRVLTPPCRPDAWRGSGRAQ